MLNSFKVKANREMSQILSRNLIRVVLESKFLFCRAFFLRRAEPTVAHVGIEPATLVYQHHSLNN